MHNTDELLNRLKALQSHGDKHFSKGVFPSLRMHKHLPYRRADESIWFSASVAYILQQTIHFFSPEQQQKSRKIITGVIQNYDDFKNADGLKTYNFFKTNPSKHFPNGFILSKIHQLKLADDADDTAMIYLTKQHPPADAEWLAKKLIKHANGNANCLKHTFKKYRNLKVYSVYFGKNIPPEIDFCVLTNILLFKHKYKLPFNEYDFDTFKYIHAVINNDEHMISPYIIAPYYPTCAQILYHIARLINITAYNELSPIKEKVATDILNNLNNASSPIKKLLLSIAALRMGLKINAAINNDISNIINSKKAAFFYSSPLVVFDSFFIRKLDRYKLFHFTHLHACCEAYVTALLLEYNMLLAHPNTTDKKSDDFSF